MHVLAALALSLITQTDQTNPPDLNKAMEIIRDLQEQVGRLENEVHTLKAQGSEAWLTEERADQIREMVQDVLADADTRASMLQGGATAGYDKGFFLASADGNYLLKFAGQLQVRAVYNHQDEGPSDDDRWGFENRRTKLFFSGHIVDPTWQYQLELDASSNGGGVSLGEFVYVQKDLGNGWKVRAGQFKPPYLREEFVSSRRLLLVERSLTNAQFTAGISQGVWLGYEGEQWRVFSTVNDGNGARATSWSVEDTEYAFTGRAEWLAVGSDWKNVDDYNAFRGGESAVLLGAGITYQNAEYGTGANLPPPDFNNAEVENLGLSADAAAKFDGFSAAIALIYRNLQADATGAELEQLALVIQGGVFLTEDLELAARYEWGDLDLAGVEDLSVVTIGLNKYWAAHNLKWQNDIGYAFNAVASNWATDTAGWRGDAPDESGQIVVRSQIQLLF